MTFAAGIRWSLWVGLLVLLFCCVCLLFFWLSFVCSSLFALQPLALVLFGSMLQEAYCAAAPLV